MPSVSAAGASGVVERFAGAHPSHFVGPFHLQGRGWPCLSTAPDVPALCFTIFDAKERRRTDDMVTACNAQSTRQFRTTWRIAKMLSVYVLARCDKTHLSGPMKKHTTWQVFRQPKNSAMLWILACYNPQEQVNHPPGSLTYICNIRRLYRKPDDTCVIFAISVRSPDDTRSLLPSDDSHVHGDNKRRHKSGGAAPG